MIMRKKSLDTLKQQKDNYLNFIKTKDKYSQYIWDLLFDDEIEFIDNIDELKKYLDKKWFSKEQIDGLVNDYYQYIRWWYFYGKKDKYSGEIKQSMKLNDKNLNQIKNYIIKEYNSVRAFLQLDVKWYVDEKIWFYDKNKWKSISLEIYDVQREIEELKEKIKINEEKVIKIWNELNWLNIFKYKKKNELRQEIENNRWLIMELNDKLKLKENEFDEKKKIKSIIETKFKNIDDIKDYVRWKKWLDAKSYELSINEINYELKNCIKYLPDTSINILKESIFDLINKNLNNKKTDILKMINLYFNYFYFWIDKNIEFLRISSNWTVEVLTNWVIPTIYSKNRIDVKINDIINGLWWNIESNDEIIVDKNFMDEIFVHTTWFNVLDEILNEWWLISTNEAMKRREDIKYNDNETWLNDIKESITQQTKCHKDVYFSRWFRKNWYWYHEKGKNDDYVFIVNTMTNFANLGYGVPLNELMQPCKWAEIWCSEHEVLWYSIISKSALNNQQDWFSRINVEDFYIFVSETKKEEIERNPKYKTKGANIIYIPKNLVWKMSYKLYEFIKNEIVKREKNNGKIWVIPTSIIDDRSHIDGIRTTYKRAFCEWVENEIERVFNPLDWSIKSLILFLKNESKKNYAFKESIELNYFELDFNEIEKFLFEHKKFIDNINYPKEFPNELGMLVVVCSKLWLWDYDDWWRKKCLVGICDKLWTFGYNQKEIWMFFKTVERLCYIIDNKQKLIENKIIRNNFIDNMVNRWCFDWNVDIFEMRELLKSLICAIIDKSDDENHINIIL